MAKGKKTGGRKKGVPNKIQADVKKAIHEAFELAGGVSYLHNLALSHPQVFCSLLGKTVPQEQKLLGDEDNPLFPSRIEIALVRPKA